MYCRKHWLALSVLLGCLTQVAQATTTDARAWLQRMSQALVQRNYDGRYIHSTDAQAETLRIVHRNQGGKITERLVCLDGSGREYVRTDTEVTTYMPDKHSVVVDARPSSDGLLNVIPEYKPELDNLYDIALGPVTKVLERRAQIVVVQPRDEFRYGYRLWLDADSAMPLKSQLLDSYGHVVEQMAFAELELREQITDRDLQPRVNTNGYDWIRYEVRSRRSIKPENVGWQVQDLPPGFKLTVTRIQPMAGSSLPVRHLVYSDGLATVSMFIEEEGNTEVVKSGMQKVGSSHAYQQDRQGYKVTAVGEVPAVTVKNMVGSLMRQTSTAVASSR